MDLQNKTILFLGSSVTYGSEGISFADIMSELCGINCIKEAVSGTTLADINEGSYVARLKTVDKNIKVDLFVSFPLMTLQENAILTLMTQKRLFALY